MGAARWCLPYRRLRLSNFEQTRFLPCAIMGLISNHSKAHGPFLFRRSGPFLNSPGQTPLSLLEGVCCTALSARAMGALLERRAGHLKSSTCGVLTRNLSRIFNTAGYPEEW